MERNSEIMDNEKSKRAGRTLVQASVIKNSIYGNTIHHKDVTKAYTRRARFLKEVPVDPNEIISLGLQDNKELGSIFGLKNIVRSNDSVSIDPKRSIVVTSAKESGYGPHRAGLSVVSCAKSLGLNPYWLDPFEISDTRRIAHIWQQKGYKKLLRLSQKSKLFNRFVFEPFSTGFGISKAVSALFANRTVKRNSC